MNPQAFAPENGPFPAVPPDKSIASYDEAP